MFSDAENEGGNYWLLQNKKTYIIKYLANLTRWFLDAQKSSFAIFGSEVSVSVLYRQNKIYITHVAASLFFLFVLKNLNLKKFLF